LNQAIIAGSVIVGIAVMMSISMIAPAFASPPWKDLYRCNNGSSDIEGSDYYVTAHGCVDITLDNRVDCDLKRGTTGHVEFKDLNPYNGAYDYPDEQTRCHKN